jgi:Flp pilus assembly protein TadG
MIGKLWTGTACGRASGILRALAQNERGAVAVIAAIVFPVVVGAMGLGAETGYWYLKKRKLQHAADVAVHAAAVRYRAGDQQPALEDAALRIASATGYLPDVGTIAVGTDTSGGSAKVAVQLTETHSRLFSSIFSKEPMLLGARAVAEIQGGSKACILALSGSSSGSVTVSGSTSVDLTNCSVAANSTSSSAFLMDGSNAKIATDCVYTVGGAVATTGLTLTQCSQPVQNAPVTPDPYADVPWPERLDMDQLPCRDLNYVSSSDYAFDYFPDGQPAIRLCGGLSVKGSLTLKPGLYIIDGGDFTVSAGASLKGDGVTFMFAGTARSKLTGSGATNLSAPTSGPYAGLLFFGSRRATGVSHQVMGNSESSLQGSLYMPVSSIEFSGNSSTTGACTQIVADRITFTGNSNIQTSCTSGMKDIVVGQTVSIIE